MEIQKGGGSCVCSNIRACLQPPTRHGTAPAARLRVQAAAAAVGGHGRAASGVQAAAAGAGPKALQGQQRCLLVFPAVRPPGCLRAVACPALAGCQRSSILLPAVAVWALGGRGPQLPRHHLNAPAGPCHSSALCGLAPHPGLAATLLRLALPVVQLLAVLQGQQFRDGRLLLRLACPVAIQRGAGQRPGVTADAGSRLLGFATRHQRAPDAGCAAGAVLDRLAACSMQRRLPAMQHRLAAVQDRLPAAAAAVHRGFASSGPHAWRQPCAVQADLCGLAGQPGAGRGDAEAEAACRGVFAAAAVAAAGAVPAPARGRPVATARCQQWLGRAVAALLIDAEDALKGEARRVDGGSGAALCAA